MTEQKKDLPAVGASPSGPAAPARPKVVYRLACGDGPCKATRIIQGTSRRVEEPVELPAPKEDES